jgi:hypothetical protein
LKALHSVGLTASTGLAVAVVAPEGIVELIAAVTGAQDDVADILVSGTFRRTIAERRLKVCSNHRWDQPIGSVLSIKELLPGDLALPRPVRFERVHQDRQVLQRPIQTEDWLGRSGVSQQVTHSGPGPRQTPAARHTLRTRSCTLNPRTTGAGRGRVADPAG